MMKTSTKIAAAVAATLAGGVAAAAPLTYAQIASATQVYLGGSSAFQTNLENNLKNIATFGGAANTLTKFADTYDGKSFLAYSLQIPNPAPADFSGLAGQNFVLYYRLKGGSVWGPGPIAKNYAEATLAVPTSAACGATITSFPGATNSCTTGTAYTLNLDAATGGPAGCANSAPALQNLQCQVPQWGISDVNPGALKGENWVSSSSGAGALGAAAPPLSAAFLANTTQLLDQVFSIVVNASGPAGAASALPKQDITQILSGEAVDWSQIPDATRTTFLAAGAITLCRRDAGSGTQTLASAFFNGTGCSPSSYGFPLPGSIFPTVPAAGVGGVVQNNSTGNLLSCVNGDVNGIGFAVVDTTQAVMTNNGGHVKAIGYDGLTQSKTNAANGTYQYWAEAASTISPGLAAGNAKSFITAIQARMQDLNQVTGSDNLVAIPGLNANNTQSIPLTVSTGGTPVAIGTTNGNVCTPIQTQL
jgi:hypothetical protein